MRWLALLLLLGSASASADSTDWGPETPPKVRPPGLEVGLATSIDVAVGDSSPAAPSKVAMARATVRWIGNHNYYIGNPVAGITAGAGLAARDTLAYNLHVELGMRAHMWLTNGPGQYFSLVAGVGRDTIGGAVPAAWTLPVDVFFQWHVGADRLAGVHAGPRLALGDRAFGWNAGVDFKVLSLTSSQAVFGLRDLAFAFDVNRIADASYVGLSVGVNSRQTRDYWERY